MWEKKGFNILVMKLKVCVIHIRVIHHLEGNILEKMNGEKQATHMQFFLPEIWPKIFISALVCRKNNSGHAIFLI